MKLNYSIGTDEEVQRIHETSLKILSEVGVSFRCETAFDIFRKHGARVENGIVYMDEKLVEKALSTLPKTYDWYDRQGNKITIGNKVTHNAPSYGPMYVCQNGKYELSNHKHLVNFHKLHETSKVIDISNPNVIDVSYVHGEAREKYRLGIALKYCQKPLMGLVEGKAVATESLETMCRFYGLEDVKRQIIATGLIDTMGPMQMSTAMSEALITYAELGQAVIICAGQTFGVTTPQSMAGVYTLGNAMILAAMVLAQLAQPGTPVVYCGKFDSSDMRLRSAAAYGGIEAMLACATSRRMADFYGVPLHSGTSNTDSKLMDYQAGAESFMNLLTAYLLKVECQVHACGLLDSMNSIGYEKFILDEEKIESLKHLMKGYAIDDSTIMFDSILKTGPTGQHFERTQKSYRRDFIMPKLSIRDNHNSWMQAGCTSAESLATKEWQRRLEEYTMPELSREQAKILDTLIPEEYR